LHQAERYRKIAEHASRDVLSELIAELLILAQEADRPEVAKWARLELGGYFRGNSALTEDVVVPEYRTVVGQYWDRYGRPLVIKDSRLDFVNEYRLRYSILELEKMEHHSGLLAIDDSKLTEMIREQLKVEVREFRFSPSCISGVLSGVRTKLIEMLQEVPPKSSNDHVAAQKVDRAKWWRRLTGRELKPISHLEDNVIRKILFLASNPTNTGRLRLDKEVREVEEGLKRSSERGQFDLTAKFAVRVGDLRRALLDYRPRIVHFSGHGAGAGGIIVEDDNGEAYEIPNDALAGLFELFAGQIECVVLNACYSDAQADAIAKHIPYVIGMKAAVSDEAAIEFAVGFYDALGAGKSVEEAFQFGRNAIALKGIPEQLIPILKKKDLTALEKERLEASSNPKPGIFIDISVMNEEATLWNRGEDTRLRYSLNPNEQRIRIESHLGYQTLFSGGGPITPLNYLSSTWCPFKWDFPTLDFKVLNRRSEPLFLTEVVFDIEESHLDVTPLLTIREDVQQSHAGDLLLINEGWCDLKDLSVSFHLSPGNLITSAVGLPYPYSLTLPLLEDRASVDVTQAFREEGVDIDGLILLSSGEWDRDTFVIPKSNGLEERITEGEVSERWKQYLGRFQEEVGTLAGEIRFKAANDGAREHRVKFHAPVYLVNVNRRGIPMPPTVMYDTAFETQKTHYRRQVPISHVLQPGEADRFTVKVAVLQSSFHSFRATIRDISGVDLQSILIEMSCFVPRSRGQFVQQAMSRYQGSN
jgi:hypothetical protein